MRGVWVQRGSRVDARRERSTFVRDDHGRFTATLPLDERCPLGLGNRTGYQRGCRCTMCTASNTNYSANRRRHRAMHRRSL